MIKLLDYNNVYRSESDTLEMKDSDKKIKKNNKKLINEESTNTLNLIPPINLLNDTGVIRYNLCQEKMNTYKGILDGIFNEEGIKLDFFDIRVHPLYGEIVYKFFDETAINDVLKLKHDISLKIGEEQFALSVNENEFVIEFKNSPNESSKISIKNVLSNINIVPNSLMSFAGIFDNSTPFVYDLVTYNTTLIIGNKGSGSTMLLSVLLSSLLLLNSPEEIDIDVLTVKDDGIVNLFNKYDYINFVPFADVMNFLDKLYIEAENNLLSIKNKIVIINNYDVLIREYDDLFVLLEKLINFGKNNLKIILTASTVNSESTNDAIFNKIMGKFILKLEHETDSVIALGDNRGLQLCGNGDGYFVDGQQGTISRFQTCYLNQKELQSILEMCKIFYKKKIN
jgi:hypothetical protein